MRSNFWESRAIRHSAAPSAFVGDSINRVPDMSKETNRVFYPVQRDAPGAGYLPAMTMKRCDNANKTIVITPENVVSAARTTLGAY
ncbi:hypothetical protein [Amycolatopsis pigmentata]|uniref:Uncharacterized protein n=1 Tax=Amycolatopsis pigmentata TaxID=450801 RepID=A0ABW5FS94_9PSEU